MPRQTPPNRIRDLLEAATRVFIRQGYRRAQMADVAQELGVAKGTLYLYVESKEALFDHAIRYAAGELADPDALPLPLATRPPDALQRDLERVLAEAGMPDSLASGLPERLGPKTARACLETILRDVFGLLSRFRTAIKLIDRCELESTELGQTFYRDGRAALVAALANVLDAGAQQGAFRRYPDPLVAARFVSESLTTWAVHIHWDPAPQEIPPAVAEETAIQMLLAALLPPD
ncbi:MAG: helix-turn-helix domain-containing protein [Myxococcota bacterium]